MKLNLVTLAVVIIGLSLFAMRAPHLPWTAWRIAGIASAASAFLLFVAARIELGHAFSVQAKATTLVTTGVYSRIRNPIYFFGAMFILGIIIWEGRPWLLLIFCGPDSAAGGAQPERGAGADGEVRRRVSRLQAKDLVLMRGCSVVSQFA
jgi:hypothetical protein